MTTTVTTKSAQVLTRTWTDLDPKVRNALDVWLLTVILAIGGISTKAMTLLNAEYLVGPVTIAVVVAYITTSKHKKLILDGLDGADDIAHQLQPTVAAAFPQAAPAAAAAVAVLDDVKARVDEQHDFEAGPDAATAIIAPDRGRFSSILDGLPSSSGKPVADPVAILHPSGVVTGSTPIQPAISNVAPIGLNFQ